MKPGEIEFDENDVVKYIVTIGDGPRDAVLRAEEFIREYFNDITFVGNVSETVAVGKNANHIFYKVVGY